MMFSYTETDHSSKTLIVHISLQPDDENFNISLCGELIYQNSKFEI